MATKQESTKSQLIQYGLIGLFITLILVVITVWFYPTKNWIIATTVAGAASIAVLLFGARYEEDKETL